MNKENTEKLLKDFPKLYRQYYLSMQQTCMCWGFDVSNDLFDIIYKLSKDIQEWSDKNDTQVEATQVKEKFGGLRFYTDYCYDEVDKMITKAEEDCANEIQIKEGT